MRETYLHRLSRPYRVTAAAAPVFDPEPAAAGEQDVVGERSGSNGSNGRKLAAERGGEVRRAVAEPELGDFAGPSVPQTYPRPTSATGRRPVGACEVCGRTLLAGEQAHEIILGERPVQACPLCVIGAQRAARARAA